MMVGIMRARAGLRVVLDTEQRLMTMGHRRHRAVVEIEVGHLDAVGGKTRCIEGKPMVLAGDLHLPGGAAGMVETAMPVTELEGGAAHGKPQNLMPETDSEQREIPLLDQTTGQLDSVTDSRRIPRPVGQEHTLRLAGQHGLQIGRCRHDRDIATMTHQAIKNGALDAEIDRNDAERSLGSVALQPPIEIHRAG